MRPKEVRAWHEEKEKVNAGRRLAILADDSGKADRGKPDEKENLAGDQKINHPDHYSKKKGGKMGLPENIAKFKKVMDEATFNKTLEEFNKLAAEYENRKEKKPKAPRALAYNQTFGSFKGLLKNAGKENKKTKEPARDDDSSSDDNEGTLFL